jgi:hypothetical protein
MTAPGSRKHRKREGVFICGVMAGRLLPEMRLQLREEAAVLLHVPMLTRIHSGRPQAVMSRMMTPFFMSARKIVTSNSKTGDDEGVDSLR